MSSLIVDKCYYTQLALHSLLQLNGQHPKDILSLKDIDELQATCNSLTPEIIFVNEDCFTSDAQSGHVLREVIDAHPGTLFFVFISKENLNYQNYVPIRKNIIILSKSIRTATIYQLIAHNLLLARSAELDLQWPLHHALRYAHTIMDTPVPPGAVAALAGSVGQQAWMHRWRDALYLRMLRPDHASTADAWTPLARSMLYLHGHRLRMPPHLLLPHLLRKTLRGLFPKEKP